MAKQELRGFVSWLVIMRRSSANAQRLSPSAWTRIASMKRALVLFSLIGLTVSHAGAQAPGIDPATVAKIRGEAMSNSQAPETHWWISEGLGPRPTGSPGYTAAADYVMKKFNEW